MTPQIGQKIFIIHILPNQTMKFGQLIKYTVRNTFLQKSCRNEVRGLVPDLFLFYKKALYKVKASFNIF